MKESEFKSFFLKKCGYQPRVNYFMGAYQID